MDENTQAAGSNANRLTRERMLVSHINIEEKNREMA